MKRQVESIRGLYAIVDSSLLAREDIEDIAGRIIDGGCGVLQLRSKGLPSGDMLDIARHLRELTSKRGVVFIVNDRVDVCLMSGADGVHLGQRDLPVREARRILGYGPLIGLSTHTLEEAIEADGLFRKGYIDYISFGPVFPTTTKEDARAVVGIGGLARVCRSVEAPVVAIGGIREERVPLVVGAGPRAFAMISDILRADDVESKVKRVIKRFTDSSREDR